MQIIPTLLTTHQSEFLEQMELFQKYYTRIQLDIADGILVPNKTTQIEEMITLFSENRALFKPNVMFDFHLMVNHFEGELEKIKKLKELGMNIQIVLINAGLNPEIAKIKSNYQLNIGLDVFPDMEITYINSQYDLNTCQAIQIMTVNPGFQGSPFLEKMLLKIEQLRVAGYKSPILIDGGVNSTTISLIQNKTYKPDILCIGSYLTKAGAQLERRVQDLNNLQDIPA
ncbi:MAG TPA: hypothetical protein PLS49_02065, partial [Candidatus Woesebacteria bacterium]|nr:hypothetical protein [Candidatus Woesebacteria bacterium]